MIRRIWCWGPAVAYMAAIYWVSGLPNLGPLPAHASDKVAHFAAYSLLGGLLARALAGAAWTGYSVASGAVAWIVAALYAVSDEFHQGFVPGRTPDAADWGADAAGAALGVIAMLLLARLRRRKEREV